MKIPGVVIDDEKVDRYTAKRRLSQHGGFEDLQEALSGTDFLEDYCTGHCPVELGGRPLLILSDINMPLLNGFETLEALMERQAAGLAPPSVVVMMFTSSSNPSDRERARGIPIVRSYIEKPIDAADAEDIFRIYMQASQEMDSAA